MRKLGRKKAHRESTLRNLATSLLLYEKIDTTEAKAKELKRQIELIIARAKRENPGLKRSIYSHLYDNNASKKLYTELIPRYKERSSGFVSMSRLQNRLGDNSSMIRVELVDKKVFVEKKSESDKNEITTSIKKPKAEKDQSSDKAGK